jgi:hypothetical protein
MRQSQTSAIELEVTRKALKPSIIAEPPIMLAI